MGNSQLRQPYQNQIITSSIKADAYLIQLEGLFYQEYGKKDTNMVQQEKMYMQTIMTQLSSDKFIEMLKKDTNLDQDYEDFIKINNESMTGKVLVYSTISMIHECLQLIVYNRTDLTVKFNQDDANALIKENAKLSKEMKKANNKIQKQQTKLEDKYSSKQKKLDSQLKNNTLKTTKGIDNFQQYNSQKQELLNERHYDQQNIEVPETNNFYAKQLTDIQFYYTNKLLPVFAKYNYNVINKKELQIKYLDYLENQYKELLLTIAKIFHLLNLYKIKAHLPKQHKYWENFKIQQQKLYSLPSSTEDENFYKCIISMLDTQIQDMIMQGNIMKMSVRFKIQAGQNEDLDTSIDIGVDQVEVQPENRNTQHNSIGFNPKNQKPQIVSQYKKMSQRSAVTQNYGNIKENGNGKQVTKFEI